jgi:hypothetical protein
VPKTILAARREKRAFDHAGKERKYSDRREFPQFAGKKGEDFAFCDEYLDMPLRRRQYQMGGVIAQYRNGQRFMQHGMDLSWTILITA